MLKSLIVVVSIIISVLLITILYNITDKFLFTVTNTVIKKSGSIQYIFIAVLLILLCFLINDITTTLIAVLP